MIQSSSKQPVPPIDSSRASDNREIVMNSRCLLFCSLMLILPLMLPGQRTRAAEKPEEKVSKQEQIKFQQEKARAHMRELEDRMFRLAKLIRETQPDDSARLLLGVRKARFQVGTSLARRMTRSSPRALSMRIISGRTRCTELTCLSERLSSSTTETWIRLTRKLWCRAARSMSF